jgi:hypothetical protein
MLFAYNNPDQTNGDNGINGTKKKQILLNAFDMSSKFAVLPDFKQSIEAEQQSDTCHLANGKIQKIEARPNLA